MPEKRAVLSRTTAAIITNMLEGVVQEGTGRQAKTLGRPAAGKTGTTNAYRDALFVGFSPLVATGVWVGQDGYASLGPRETGAKAALPIWIEFMRAALDDSPHAYFDLPDDVVRITMDPVSGARVAQGDPKGVVALFRRGAGPAPKP